MDYTVIEGKICEITDRGFRQVRPLVVNEKDNSIMVLVPPGEFEMGDGQDKNCPKHQVYLDAFYISVYAVTNWQYGQFVKETGHRAPDTSDSSYNKPVWQNGRCPEDKLDHPVVCVSWDDAVAYAKWAGAELPTEAQWEKAARGPQGFIYPWGNNWDEGKCRHDKNKGQETTCPVWGYGQGVSGYGTYNQSGNVWEWCRDWYGDDFYTKSPRENPTGPVTGSRRVDRGGGWGRSGPVDLRAADRRGRAPGRRNGSRGFRLVRAAS